MTPRDVTYSTLTDTIQGGDVVAPVPFLTFTVDNAATVGVDAAGSITNDGIVASGPWSIAAVAGVTVSPSSGSSIAPGGVVALTFTLTAAGTTTHTLTCAGATIIGNPQQIVAVIEPILAVLTGSEEGTVGEAVAFAVTLDAQADQTYTVTPSATGSAVVSPSTRTITAGNTVGMFTVTGAEAETVSVDFTISPSLTRVGRPISLVVSAGALPGLTLSAVSTTGAVGTPGTATITNNGASSCQWTLSTSAGMTVSPSSGTLASGASISPILAYSTTGTKTLTLTNNSGGTITGTNPASITVTAAAATVATLALSTSGTTGSNTTGTVTLNGVAPSAGTVTIAGSGATITPSTLSWAAGESGAAKSFTINRATDGATSVSITNSMGLTNAGTPVSYASSSAPVPADFVSRRTGAGVIAWQGFATTSEVTAFAKPRDTDFHSVPLYREDDDEVGSCMVFKFLGARLAADFPASGGNGPRAMVLDDASDWPTTFPFRFFVTRVPLGETGPARKKTLFECTARTGNTLTVTYVPLGISEFDSGASFTDRVIGDAAGSECQNYSRLFSAMTGADNGKGVADPAASGTLPVRSRIPGNPSAPPQGPSMFGYGYCAHPDYVSDARFNPWVPGYQGTGLGDGVSRSNIIDTSEIYIQFRAWFDADTQLPDMTGGKIVGIQTETTTPQQIVMGMGPGGGAFSIPSTPEAPFALAKFSHTSFGSAGRSVLKDPYETSGVTSDYSYQPGSFDPVTGKSWALTAIAAVSGQPSTGQDTPDGNSAWEHKYGRWVTFLWRIKPGKTWHYSVAIKTAWNSATQSTFTLLDSPDEWPTENFQIRLDIDGQIFDVASRVGAVFSGVTLVSGSHVNLPAFSSTWVQKYPATPAGAAALSTLLEVKFADLGDTEYTTLFSVDNYPILYGSRGQAPNYFDDSIAGFSAVDFWGYRNTDLSSVAPYKVLYQRFAQLIISKNPIPVPLPAAPPAPSGAKALPVFQNAGEFDNGGSFTTTLGGTFNVGTGPSTGVVVRVVSHSGSGGGTISSLVIGGVTLTALAQRTLTGFNATERVFYGVNLGLTGSQAWTATIASATRITVQLFAAHSVLAFDAGVAILTAAGNTLAQAVTPDANSIHVGLLHGYIDSGAVVTAKSGTMERVNSVDNFAQSLIFTEDGPSDPSMNAVKTGGVFSANYIGRIVRLQGAVPAAPSWVPAAGSMAELTVANGKLTNNFVSQCAPYFDPYFYPRTANTFGGAFKNPHWGTYGCTLYFSGGHGNINDNSVTVAEYGASAVTFRRITDPTPWFGTGTDSTTKINNSADVSGPQAFLDWTGAVAASPLNYGINSIDGAPGSSHTYGSGDIIPPGFGGAAHGTYSRVWTPAINRANTAGAVSALALDLNDPTAASSTRTWRKQSLNRVNEAGFGSAPVLTQIVPQQNRTYIVSNGQSAVKWFDHTTGNYVTGTGAGFDFDSADTFFCGTLFYVSSRGILVCAYRFGGNIRLQWMDVTVAQPTLGGTVTLSGAALPVNGSWGGATYCCDLDQIILGGVTGDFNAFHYVTIPALGAFGGTWAVTRHALPSGSWPEMGAPRGSDGEFKRMHYDERIKAIFYLDFAKRTDQGPDTAYVYKPVGT